ALMQRRADAPDHAADQLRPRGLGIVDPAGVEHAQHAAQPDLACGRVDAELDEVRAVAVLRELLEFIPRAGLDLGLQVAGALTRRELLLDLEAGIAHRWRAARRAERAARPRRVGIGAV